MAASGATRRFEHVISLGFFCGPAEEAQRYGLRDASYPFDWMICDIQPVVTLMETDFAGLLELENLQRNETDPSIVRDTRFHLDLYHDFSPESSVENQHAAVSEKYRRRVDRFYRSVAEPTLFIRYIGSPSEFAYIDANEEGLVALLRSWNPRNDLLLVANASLPERCGGHRVYRVPPDPGDVVARDFVAKNPALLMRLLLLPYPIALRWRNYRYYRASARGKQNSLTRRILRRLAPRPDERNTEHP